MTTTVDELAIDLAVDPGDIRVIVESLADVHDDELPAALAAEVRRVLDPNGERTAPAGLYWPGHSPESDEGGSSPTRAEGFYPDEEHE